jgi:hypothetical protein
MGFSRRRPGKDGRPRYTAYYRDLRGREVSAGAFARKADADAAWQAAEANARGGLRRDPGRGRQRFSRYAGAVWLPNHRMELSTRADRGHRRRGPVVRRVPQPARERADLPAAPVPPARPDLHGAANKERPQDSLA